MATPHTGSGRSMDGPIRRVQTPSHQLPLAAALPRKRSAWHWVRTGALVVVAVVVMGGGWFAFKGVNAARNIIARSDGGAPALSGPVNLAQLKGEGDGRINVLVLGIGGQGHDGATLSDTIMVESIDPKTKNVAMLSVPRDLYVKIPATATTAAQYGKINSANAIGGPELASKVVSGIIGVPIHYYVVVDFSGFKQAVDAVGGVDVDVPNAISDPRYPCDNENGRFCPFAITAGPHHLDGTLALRYSRSRETTSDFDRAARQQIVVTALRAKALQVSTLTNPVKLSSLIDAVGAHVTTDIQPAEITKFVSIIKDLDMASVTQKVLDTSGPTSLLVDGTGTITGAGSIELPRAGQFDYSDIQDFVKNIFVDHYITDENARLDVQNGSGLPGLASGVVKSLQSAHYNVGEPGNAAEHYDTTVIYDYTGGQKPYTINYLEQRFGVKAQKQPALTPTVDATGAAVPAPEIRIILGSDVKAPTSQ